MAGTIVMEMQDKEAIPRTIISRTFKPVPGIFLS